jgi:hypothetical protein
MFTSRPGGGRFTLLSPFNVLRVLVRPANLVGVDFEI